MSLKCFECDLRWFQVCVSLKMKLKNVLLVWFDWRWGEKEETEARELGLLYAVSPAMNMSVGSTQDSMPAGRDPGAQSKTPSSSKSESACQPTSSSTAATPASRRASNFHDADDGNGGAGGGGGNYRSFGSPEASSKMSLSADSNLDSDSDSDRHGRPPAGDWEFNHFQENFNDLQSNYV